MNNSTDFSTDKSLKRRLTLFIVLAAFGLSTLYSAVLWPLLRIVSSNIEYIYTYLPTIIYYSQRALEILLMIFAYAITIYAIYRFGLKASIGFITLYLTSIVYKYALQYFVNFFIDGIPNYVDDPELLFDLITLATYILLEAAQYLLIVLIASKQISKADEIYKLKKKSANKLGVDLEPRRNIFFPFRSILDTKNALQLSALVGGVILSALRIVMHLMTDFQIGAPTSSAEFFWMMTNYFGDLIIGGLVYLATVYLFIGFDKLDLKLTSINNK